MKAITGMTGLKSRGGAKMWTGMGTGAGTEGWARAGVRAGAAVAASLSMAAALSGCQSVQGSSPVTLVRVIDASYNAPAVSVNIGQTAIAADTAGQTITNYAYFPPEASTAYVYPAGARTPSASTTGDFLAGQEHSVYLTDAGAGYTATILTDQDTAPPTGYISVRFLQQAIATGAVDVYFVPSGDTISDAKPVLSDLTVGSVTDYINIPAGSYSVVITPTGVATASYTGTSIAFSAGQVRTMLIMDAQLTTNPPVNVIVGDDLN